MKKFLTITIIAFTSFITIAHGLVIDIPDSEGNKDISSTIVWSTQITGDESSFFQTIQMVNQYLWMSLWLVCMVLLVISGIGLITANGDEKKMKNANKTLIGSLIGILISVSSWAAIKLVIGLF